jgi:hypothetical protein
MVEHIVKSHLPEAVQQRARVIEHDPRLAAFFDQLRNELAHPLVAPVKHRRVVVVANGRALHHELEIADDAGGRKVATSGGNERLMHVKGNRRRAPDATEVQPAFPTKPVPVVTIRDCLLDRGLPPRKIWQAVNRFGERIHVKPPVGSDQTSASRYLCRMCS